VARAKKKGSAVDERAVDELGPPPGEIVGSINGHPIRRLKVSEINAAFYNPRDISEKALAGLGASVSEFGLVEALVWNVRTRRLVGGHQRLKTLDPDSTTEVVQVDLDEVREKALNALLNDRSKQGDWTASIGDILDEIEASAPDLFERTALDDLRVEIPTLDEGEGVPMPDEGESTTVSETTTVQMHRCPQCGHEFR
jgi:hypothetical protein